MTSTTTRTSIIELAETLSVTPGHILGLAEQLAELDGDDAVYLPQPTLLRRTFDTAQDLGVEDRYLTADAVEQITEMDLSV